MGCSERPGCRWRPVAGPLCPRMLNENTLEEKDLTDTADPPRAGPSHPLPHCRPLPVACTELAFGLLVGVGCVPALSEKPAFSSCLSERVACFRSPEGLLPDGPLGCTPRNAFCARRLLSLVYRGPRLPAPSSGRDHAGQSFVGLPLCAELVVGNSVSGGRRWGRAAHTPACAVPPSPRGSSRGRGCRQGRRWAPGPTRLPVSPVPSVACVPPTRVHVSATLAARACRAWCVPRALGRVRLPPRPTPVPRRRSHGRWNRGSPPPPPLHGVLEDPCLAGLASLSGADSFRGNGGRPRPARRRTSGPAAARRSSSAGVGVCIGFPSRWLASPWVFRGGSLGLGSAARCRGRGGTAPGGAVCSVIPAGFRLACPVAARPSGLPRSPCEASSPAGGPCGRPCRRRPSLRRVVPPPCAPAVPRSLASTGRPAAVLPGPPARGGSRARTGRGRSPWRSGAGPPGGREKLRFEGRPGPAAAAAPRVVFGGCVRGGSRPAR